MAREESHTPEGFVPLRDVTTIDLKVEAARSYGPGPHAQGELGGESGPVMGIPVVGPLSKGKPWFQELRILFLEGYEWYKLRACVGHNSRYEEENQMACGTGRAPSLGWVWHLEWAAWKLVRIRGRAARMGRR